MKKQKTHVNSAGASYFAVNAFGWATAKTPWEAMANLDLVASGNTPSVKGPKFKKATEDVSLYYLPDEDAFQGTNFYAPVDKDGKPYGIPIYVGLSEHNEKIIKEDMELLATTKKGK